MRAKVIRTLLLLLSRRGDAGSRARAAPVMAPASLVLFSPASSPFHSSHTVSLSRCLPPGSAGERTLFPVRLLSFTVLSLSFKAEVQDQLRNLCKRRDERRWGERDGSATANGEGHASSKEHDRVKEREREKPAKKGKKAFTRRLTLDARRRGATTAPLE